MALKALVKKGLIKKAKDNSRIVTKKGSEQEIVVKEGVPLDHTVKHNVDKSPKAKVNSTFRQIGLNKGCTINMGDYESLRFDCWLSKDIQENESVAEAVDLISNIIDDVMTQEVERLKKKD